jgi:undecaprenyl-diphosphatase
MNPFDLTILQFLTSFANASPAFDRAVNSLLNLELLKGGVTMALFWAAWFGSATSDRRRETLTATLFAAGVALFLAMSLAMLLPFRVRPMLAFQSPGMVVAPSWREWSAFPSDHATLFFALATGIFRAAPRLGCVALGHALIVVCLPRVYVGVHYPSDVLGGGLLGAGIAYALTTPEIARTISAWPLAQMKKYPGVSYAAFFVLSFLIATLFGDLRQSALAIYEYLTS